MAVRLGIGNIDFRNIRPPFSWSRWWVTQSECYELWKITGAGNLVGLKRGDILTVGGTVGSYTFQVPNTVPYQTYDTDYIWFKTDVTWRTATEAEMIGYDFSRTIVKYGNTSPYSIDYIMILASAPATAQENKMRDNFDLSIWWNGFLSLYGNLKDNRGAGQSVWAPEAVYPSILTDGNSFGLYLTSIFDLATITKNGSDIASGWNDKLGSGNDFVTGSCLWSAIEGMTFNGINQYLKTAAKVLNQPLSIYMKFKQKSWTSADCIMDGISVASAPYMIQTSSSPQIKIFCGTAYSGARSLTLNTWGIVRIFLDGINSKWTIDAVAFNTGNYGANNMGGVTIGSNGSGVGSFSDINIKGIAIRKIWDAAGDQTDIFNYINSL